MLKQLLNRVRPKTATRGALALSVALHLVLLIVSGSIIILSALRGAPAQFQSVPPQRPHLDPRKLEMKVKVQDLQRRSARPRLQPRLMAAGVSRLPLPEIKVTPQAVKQKLSAKYSTFGMAGFGSGIGGGLGDGMGGGEGLGAAVNFFGLQGAGQRIALLLDVSGSMCEDERGGVKGYAVVKARIKEVIRGLPAGTLFNVIAYGDGCSPLWNKMQPATETTREESFSWIDQYNNIQGPFGLKNAGYFPGTNGIPAAGGTSRMDMALTAAFEQKADTIFVITDGIPEIKKLLNEKEMEEWRRANEMARAQAQVGAGEVTQEDVDAWETRKKAFEAEQARRLKKGLGPKVTESGEVKFTERKPVIGQRRGGRSHSVPWPMWSQADVLDHIDRLQKTMYEDNKLRRARIHIIGYGVDEQTRSFLRTLARRNKGGFRVVKGFF